MNCLKMVINVQRCAFKHKDVRHTHTHIHNYMDCPALNFCSCMIFSLRPSCVNYESDLALLDGRSPKQMVKWCKKEGKGEERSSCS